MKNSFVIASAFFLVVAMRCGVAGADSKRHLAAAAKSCVSSPQIGTWTHHFQKRCSKDYCREQVVFPLMISKRAQAEAGTIQLSYSVISSQPGDWRLHFALYKNGYQPGEPIDGMDQILGYHLDLTGANSPSGWTINLGPVALWGDFTFVLEAYGRHQSGMDVVVTISYPLVGPHKPQRFLTLANASSAGRGLEKALAGDRISYTGSDWDPKGGPIEVFLGRKRLAIHRASCEFRGSFRLPVWTTGNCQDTLKAIQGHSTRKAAVGGQAVSRVEAASTGMKIGRRILRKGVAICGGEKIPAPKTGKLLITRALQKREISGYDGLWVQIDWPGPKLNSVVNTKGVFADIVEVPSKKVVVRGDRLNVREWDPAREGSSVRDLVRNLPDPFNEAVLAGFCRSAQSMFIEKLNIHGGLLYVAGSLTSLGPLSGEGAVVAEQNMTLAGTVQVSSDSEGFPSDEIPIAPALIAGGRISFAPPRR